VLRTMTSKKIWQLCHQQQKCSPRTLLSGSMQRGFYPTQHTQRTQRNERNGSNDRKLK